MQTAKKNMWFLLMLGTVVFFTNLTMGDAYHDSIINGRLAWGIDKGISAPYYDANSTSPAEFLPGKAEYALASLYKGVNLTKANQYIYDLCTYQDIRPPIGLVIDVNVFWEMPLIWRMYLDPNMYNRMTSTTRSYVIQLMFRWVDSRSKVSDAQSSTWNIANTENIDSLLKSSYLLCCQALGDAGYDSTVLDDGNTIAMHKYSWQKYFFEYFKQRAKEGLSCEIASISYARTCLMGWYNIRDFSDSADLRKIADDCITLYFADVATDFMPSVGLRGASGNRWYKDTLTYGQDSLSNLLYCYGWHDNRDNSGVLPDDLFMFTSSYRPPEIVRLIGGTANRNPYLTSTRRYGKGDYVSNGEYTVHQVTFGDHHSSDIRRKIWWHNDYVLSDLELRTDADLYTHLIDNDRAMGIFFSSNIDDRIIFHGKGTMESLGKEIGYTEITGVCGENCLVAARDKNYTYNDGVRIFVPDGPLGDNLYFHANSGWTFTQTGPFGGVGKLIVADANASDDPTRNNELMLCDMNDIPVHVSALTTGNGGHGGSGEAIRFIKSSTTNGDMACSTKRWQDYNSVSIDFYFKSDRNTDTNDQVLMGVPGTWKVYINANAVKFKVWTASSSRILTKTSCVNTSIWQHLQASIDAGGNMSLTVDSNNTTSTGAAMLTTSTVNSRKYIGLGTSCNNYMRDYDTWYSGLIDDVRITLPSMSGNPTIAVWNMDATYSRDVYVAFRIAAKVGSSYYTTTTTADSYSPGVLLDFTDADSPVAFEVASAEDYDSYAAFQVAVKDGNATRWIWDSGTKHLTYTSLAGPQYEYWGNSGNMPKIDGVTVGLNTLHTYGSPYLNGVHGMDTQTISYPGKSSLVLNFNYTKSPMWDDYQTIGLWHMDAVSSGKILDDDLENSTRNNDLTLYNGATVTTDGGKFVEALSLNGIDKYGQAAVNWAGQGTVKIDMWFKASTTSGDHALVAANNIWELRQHNADMVWYTYYAVGSVRSVTVSDCVDNSNWHHVTASIDAGGVSSLTVDDATQSVTDSARPLLQTSNVPIWVGEKGNARYFWGWIDDVKIATYDAL